MRDGRADGATTGTGGTGGEGDSKAIERTTNPMNYENGKKVISVEPVYSIDELDSDTRHDMASQEPDVYRNEDESEAKAVTAITRLLLLIIDAERPRFVAYQIADSVGALALIGGTSGAEIAKKFGVSRQDYEQQLDSVREKLGLNTHTRRQKNESASETYKMTNFKNTKPKTK